MDEIISNELKRYLKEGEKVLWTEKCDSEESLDDLWVILGSIICVLFALFIEIGEIVPSAVKYENENGFIPSTFYIGFFIPVVFVLFVILNARYVVIEKNKIKENTIYAVTDKRILIVMGGKEKKLIEKDINELTEVNISDMSLNKPGVGTIAFGEVVFNPPYIKDGRRVRAKRDSQIDGIPLFNDIEDVAGVYVLINSLRNKN